MATEHVYLRNKVTGEIRDVEADSDEFRELQAAVTSRGLGAWEQTSLPHVEDIRDRARTGNLREEDLGLEAAEQLRYEALKLAAEGVEAHNNPHLRLTPGEIEGGLTPQQKAKDLMAQYEDKLSGARRRILMDAAQSHLEDGEEIEEPTGGDKGQLARAGGSDEREGVPMHIHPDTQSEVGDSEEETSAPITENSEGSTGADA